MTFSPKLEERFAQMVHHYPEGRQKAALIPMLMYAQDEVGWCDRSRAFGSPRECGQYHPAPCGRTRFF